jgi:hypothetical protein
MREAHAGGEDLRASDTGIGSTGMVMMPAIMMKKANTRASTGCQMKTCAMDYFTSSESAGLAGPGTKVPQRRHRQAEPSEPHQLSSAWKPTPKHQGVRVEAQIKHRRQKLAHGAM